MSTERGLLARHADVSISVLLLVAVWIAAARYAGRRHRELTAAP